jgi:PAS domain S-box-containing protein
VARSIDSKVTQREVLRAILDSPREMVIFALDRRYRYLAFNEAHRRVMKATYDVEIALCDDILTRITRPEDRVHAKGNFDRALAGEHFSVVEPYDAEDGSRRYYDQIYSPITGPDGSVTGFTVFLYDVTTEKRAQEDFERYQRQLEELVQSRTAALRASEERYRTLVEHAPIAVVVHREDEILYCNPAAVALCGAVDARALATQSLSDLIGRERAALVMNQSERTEFELRRQDGSHAIVEWTSIPVDFDGQPSTMALAVDVTARRRLEEELRHTQKLESLGLLAGSLAHDFNNLLVGILGNADLGLTYAGHVEVIPALRRIKTAAMRASELTGQMLAYSGNAPFVIRPLDVSQVASEMSDLLRVSIPKGARLVLDLGAQLPAVEGDPAQLRQVVMNLITNAADAVGDADGTITLRTSSLLAGRELHLDPGRYVRLQVEDSGAGMDDATRKRIFEPFFTTKVKGRGLGLAAVVGIVRAHRGTITVDSTPGNGATFTVYLPASSASVPSVSELPVEDWRGTGTVLVADDEPRVRQVLSMMLSGIGFEVLEADSAQAALATYREHRDAINAIMVDLSMPGGGGREVVRALRAEGQRVPIVMSSGYSAESIGPELRADPRLEFLEKPFEYETLVKTLKRAMEAA